MPDGSCTFDADCAPSDLCTAGTCLQRPTAFDPGLGYECTTACDCRQGETCDGTNHCVNDVIDFGDGASRSLTPTFWAQAGATGNGASPTTPGDPAVGMAQLAAGNNAMIALRGGDSLTIGAPMTLAQGDVAIAGGYHVCAANRWIRDSSLRTTISSSVTSVINLSGTVGTTLPHVAILGLSMATTDSNYGHRRVFVDATYAPSLFVEDSDFAPVFLPDVAIVYGSIICDHCDAVAMTDITTAGWAVAAATSVRYHGISITTGSGTFTNVTVNGLVGAYQMYGIDIGTTTGPVAINNAQIGSSESQTGAGISVTCGVDMVGASLPLTIGNSSIGWNTQNLNSNDDGWNGLALTSCASSTVHDVTIDGGAATDVGGGDHFAIALTDSAGTFTNLHAILPTTTSTATVHGFELQGPRGALTISHPTISGGSDRATLVLVNIANVTQGAVAIDHATFSSVSGSSVVGLAVASSGTPGAPAVIVTDSSIAVNGSENANIAAQLTTSTARIERTSLVAGPAQDTDGVVVGASSELELYDSFVFTDAPTPNNVATALTVTGASQVRGVGDTIDANGSLSSVTVGLSCEPTSRLRLSSSLVSGGLGSTHVIASAGGGAATCLDPANFDHNYFWYARPGASDPTDQIGDIATAAVGVPDGNGNILGDNVSCYDGAFPTPNYHIVTGSPCIDAGVAGTRQDDSPFTLDITGGPRALGLHPDIGCFEKQ